MTTKTETFLNDLAEGKSAVVTSLEGNKGFKEKLIEQGIFPGIKITVLSGGKKSPFLLKAGSTRVMIGNKMAQKIKVSC